MGYAGEGFMRISKGEYVFLIMIFEVKIYNFNPDLEVGKQTFNPDL